MQKAGALLVTAYPPQNKREALETICAAVREFTEHGVTPAELDRAREQSKANVPMGLESTQAHMSNLGRGKLMQGRVLEPEGIVAAYDAVSPGRPGFGGGAVRLQVASLLAVGRVRTADEYRAFWK